MGPFRFPKPPDSPLWSGGSGDRQRVVAWVLLYFLPEEFPEVPEEMKDAMRPYRVPVAVTALMVLGVVFWAWQSWHGFLEREQEMRRQFTMGHFESISGALKALVRDGHLQRDEAVGVLESIIRHSPVRYVILQQDGGRILQAGEVPANLDLAGDDGEAVIDECFVYWHSVRIQGDRDQVMVLSLEPPDQRGGVPPPVRGWIVTLSAALLFIAASFVAWIMTVRGRLLAEQLKGERARRAHLEELGLAAAGLAHETKNPLGIISGIAQRILAAPEEPQQSREMLEYILDEVDKATARLGNFMAFARQREATLTPVRVREVGLKVATILRPDFDAARVSLEIACDDVRIVADEEMLRQILVNLILNSLHASPADGVVRVRLEHEAGPAALIVEDHGRGIAPELLPNIFKPYVAGSSEGHGLGLAIVKRLVEEHGWTVSVESDVGRGTVVRIAGIALLSPQEGQP